MKELFGILFFIIDLGARLTEAVLTGIGRGLSGPGPGNRGATVCGTPASRRSIFTVALTVLVLALLTQAEPASADESVPCVPEPTDMSIRYSDVVACAIDIFGDVDIFRFPGTTGETVTVRSSKFSGGANTIPCVELFDPLGSPLGSDCLSQGARLEATLGLTGLHSVLVSEFPNDNTMDYSFVVERVAPPSPWALYICPGCNLQGSIDPFGDIDLFFFVGTAGDAVSILGTKLAGGVNTIPCVELYDPAGGLVDSDCLSTGAQINATLGLSGQHSIVVSEFPNDNTMDYTLSYQCIAGACIDIGRILFADGFESGDTSAWSGSVP